MCHTTNDTLVARDRYYLKKYFTNNPLTAGTDYIRFQLVDGQALKLSF